MIAAYLADFSNLEVIVLTDYEKVEYWLESSEYDFQTAKAMLETKRLLYVGFMCHQAVEKALKAIFVSRHPDEELPYIHRLLRLCNLSGISEELDEGQLQLIDVLSPMNIEARYPMHKEKLLQSLTVERCQTLIDETEALCSWLKKKC